MVRVSQVTSLGKGKYQVNLDNGMTLELYRTELHTLHIEEGSSLSDEELTEAFHLLTVRAQKRSVHLLEKMDRTEKQLREKLLLSHYPEECIDRAIAYLKDHHFLDDLRYACNYVRYHGQNLSAQMLRQKLQQKGVNRKDIEQAIAEEYEGNERRMIKELLAKKHFDADSCDQKEYAKVYQHLLRRGFHSSDILAVMKSHTA